MTMTDTELRDALAPLAERSPTDAEIAAVLAAAETRRGKPRRWPRRFVAAVAVASAAVGTVSIALPGAPPETERTSGVALLQTAAAVAADQPPPPAFAGYRYTEMLDHWRWPEGMVGRDGEEVEQRVETWVDRDWRGRRVAHQGRVIEGTARTAEGFFVRPSEREYIYGDGPKPDVAELPTEPAALRDALLRVYRSLNWAPGHPTRDQEHHDLVRQVLILLDSANVTPEQRAGLWGVLALMPGVEATPDKRDPVGRTGKAVTIPARSLGGGGGGTFTVIFDPENSELLSWSLAGAGGGIPDQTHTILRGGHVRAVGDRSSGER